MLNKKISGRDDIWLKQASASDFDLTFAIKKSAGGQYIANLFGWDEQVQIEFHKNQFCPENTSLIVQGGTVVGWISVFDHDDHTKIDELYVLPEFQGKGIGTSVLHQVVEHVTMRQVPLRLRVFGINRGGIRLYKRLGFAQRSADGPFLHMELLLPEKRTIEDS